MGSLPELTERARPPPQRAARTVSDPHRHRTNLAQLPVSTICKKEWLWKKGMGGRSAGAAGGGGGGGAARRRDSGASSLGAASMRRLLARAPARLPRPLVRRFTLLCVATALGAAGLLPFTAVAGAEGGAAALALMHATAALTAPASPALLRVVGARALVSAAHAATAALLCAAALSAPAAVLLPLCGVCGALLSPQALALAAAADGLAAAAGEEARRRVALRRALRALRAAADAGLLAGALLLAAALAVWPPPAPPPPVAPNLTLLAWPSPDDYLPDDDYEELACGAAGCPGGWAEAGGLGAAGRALAAGGAMLAASGALLALLGAPPAQPPPPAPHSALRDPRALLAAPMGLFIGLQQGFIYTSYIKWYGVCVGGWWGAWRALCGQGALQALAAGTLSMAAARGRRGALAAGGAAAHGSLLLALVRWRAARADLALPALAAAAWGACAALWDVLQTGLGVGGSAWAGPWALTLSARHAGLAVGCAARALLCARSQLAALAVALVAALASHAALELRHRRGLETARARS